MARIVSLGSALQDIFLIDHDDLDIIDVDRGPVYGGIVVGSKVDIDEIKYKIGGGGVNSAVTFARHGHDATFIGNIAEDQAGDAVMMLLNREGINSQYVRFLPYKNTGASVILLDTQSGERTILTCRGASAEFGNFDENILDEISPDWLYTTSLRGDFDTLEKFFRRAHELGVKVMFNPGGEELKDTSRLLSFLKFVDILNVNQHEASFLTGEYELVKQFDKLREVVGAVIITAGREGGIAGNSEEAYRFGLYDDTVARDATGAGDAFGSGFLAHLAEGGSLYESLVFASANSTSVIKKIGANEGALTRRESLHSMPIEKL